MNLKQPTVSRTTLYHALRRAFRPLVFTSLCLGAAGAFGQYEVENLDRGLVAVDRGNGSVFVSWRWLGAEPENTAFNVYRDGVQLNNAPLTERTNFVDNNGNRGAQYSVETLINGQSQGQASTDVWGEPFHRIPIQRPSGGTTPTGENYSYSPNDTSVGDLDGDGDYEIVVKWDPSNAKDNSQSGYTGNVYLDAYELDGTQLWRIDLGRNIRAGAHYTQFLVYDADSDGRAEVAVKTADGTRDGQGNVIGEANADHRNSGGYILSGPEYLTVFEGSTGRELDTVNYVPARGNVSSWGDNYGNRVDRFLATVAYLDGQNPSFVFARGYYTRSVLAAWDFENGQLQQRWVFDSDDSGNGGYAGQGAHSLTVGDVDEDGRQEIVYGAMTVDDNGTGLYTTGLGHGDALHLSDMNPDRPGQEVFMVHECASCYGEHGIEMHDAGTGQILWSDPGDRSDIGRGVAMDVDPNSRGYEAWASDGGLFSATGQTLSSSRPGPINFGVWWDGDLLRETLDREMIDKWNPATNSTERLLTAYQLGAASNNGTKGTPALSADLLGDWREEVLWRHSDNNALLLFTTTTPSDHRLRTLMHDPQYRVAISWQNSGYNQPPHPSFYLGAGMDEPPAPNIRVVGGGSGSSSSSQSSSVPTDHLVLQEQDVCTHDGTVDSNHSGHTGSGFINTTNEVGSRIEWQVNISEGGNHDIFWLYANGADDNRSAGFWLNTSDARVRVNFPGTGAWNSWQPASTTAYLPAGSHRLTLEAATEGGLANIDRLEIAGPGIPEAGNCDGASSSSFSSSVSSSSASSVSSVASSAVSSVQSSSAPSGQLSCTVDTNDWGSGFVSTFTVSNDTSTAVDGWAVDITFGQAISVGNSWSANIEGSGAQYQASGVEYNDVLAPGESISFGLQGSPSPGSIDCQ
ncbi:cellulose binding domain-containing protein [Marinimicrobium locisalis]|uniref:rhamnogalacturonan lyase family protein n=1 Tax=Marinimicrobium locisalis TaxID=546022 RepID=UPI00322168D0